LSLGTPQVAVWKLALSQEITQLPDLNIIDATHDVFLRQRAQRGLFTKLQSSQHYDLESYLQHKGFAHHLTKYTIQWDVAGEALHDLDRMTINYYSLFPDLDGAAKQIELDERIRLMLALSARDAEANAGNSVRQDSMAESSSTTSVTSVADRSS
jgi:hypothetical protein